MNQHPQVPGLPSSFATPAMAGGLPSLDATRKDDDPLQTIADVRLLGPISGSVGIAPRWPALLLTRPSSSQTMSQSERAFLSGRHGCSD